MQTIDRRYELPPQRVGSISYESLKRLMDVSLSLCLLISLAPVFVLCALAVRLSSPGPVFFRQTRVGAGGVVFTMLKFRSMYADADQRTHQAYATAFINGTAALHVNDSGAVYKLVNDNRITPAGRWLRRTSLDELPQLLNVLRGDMSLVGPRPPIPYEVERYQPEHMRRLAVLPGITGLWQVTGRSTTTFDEMVQIDLEYIQTRSLALDTWVLLRTIPEVLARSGAH